MTNKGITQAIRTYAPDFCWMTSQDLYLMFEQMFPDIEFDSFRVMLSVAKKAGYFETKKGVVISNPSPMLEPAGWIMPYADLYLRVK